MKVKHFLSGATLLSAALLLNAPLSAAVESDTVGYTTIEMQAGKWYQIGNPFVELEDGTDYSLNDAFSSGFQAGDRAYIYDPKTGTYLTTCVWAEIGGTAGWYDLATDSLFETPLSAGTAIFFNKAHNGEVTLKGRVDPFVEVDVPGEAWSQVAFVYPVAQTLNEMHWEGLEDGDQAYVYDSKTGSYSASFRWIDRTGLVKGWYDIATDTLTEAKIPVAQAIFINKRSASNGKLSTAVVK